MAETPDPAAGGTPASDAAATAAAAAAAANPSSQPGAAAAAAGTEKPAGEQPAAGEKPAGDTPAGEQPAGEQPPAGAPEKYSLTLPENGPLDASDLTQIEQLARANNLTNEQAQTLLTGHAERVAAQHKAWHDATAADAEIGGAQLEATTQATNRLLDSVMPKTDPDRAELDQLLQKEGLGNRRVFVKVMARLARRGAEDPTLGRAPGGEGRKSAADVLFGNKQ